MTSPSPDPQNPPPRAVPRRELRAPNWLQIAVILALFASAIFVAFDGRYLWCALLALAAIAFGISFLLRHMVGDDYGRT